MAELINMLAAMQEQQRMCALGLWILYGLVGLLFTCFLIYLQTRQDND